MKQLIYLLLLSAILSSCITKYVPIENVRTEYKYIDRVKYDSIYQRDSIYIRESRDTTYINVYKYIYRDKLIRDTIHISKTDSIQVPYLVEKKLTKWQAMKIELGGWAFGIIVAFALVIVGLMVYKKRNK